MGNGERAVVEEEIRPEIPQARIDFPKSSNSRRLQGIPESLGRGADCRAEAPEYVRTTKMLFDQCRKVEKFTLELLTNLSTFLGVELDGIYSTVRMLSLSRSSLQREVTKLKDEADRERERSEVAEAKLTSSREDVEKLRKDSEEKLCYIEGERDVLKREIDAALCKTRNLESDVLVLRKKIVEQKAHAAGECDDNLKLKKKISAALCKKRKLENDVLVLQEEMAEQKLILEQELANQKLNLEQAHELKLEKLQKESMELDVAEREKNEYISQIASMAMEVSGLEEKLVTSQRMLAEETEKSLCGICLESSKDTISFPCLHLHFCFQCLEKHRTLNNACPACRTPISGVLRCDISK